MDPIAMWYAAVVSFPLYILFALGGPMIMLGLGFNNSGLTTMLVVIFEVEEMVNLWCLWMYIGENIKPNAFCSRFVPYTWYDVPVANENHKDNEA
jgi:hypothetical protein